MKKRKLTSLGSSMQEHAKHAFYDLARTRYFARNALRSTKTSCLDAARYVEDMNESYGKAFAEMRHIHNPLANKVEKGVLAWRRGAQEAFVRRCVGAKNFNR